MKPTFFLDMDGVLADFIGAIAEKFDRDLKDMPKVHDLMTALSCSQEVIDKAIANDYAFWINIEPLPWAQEVYNILLNEGDVFVLSRPWCNSIESVEAKYSWLQNQMGIPFDNIILTKHKHLLADKRRILVDDYRYNCREWAKHGGVSVLFPARHNPISHFDGEDFRKSIHHICDATS